MTNSAQIPDSTNHTALADWVAAYLYTAVVADCLDSVGLRNQSLQQDIRPLDEDLVLAGRAKTALWQPVPADEPKSENPYATEIEYIDSASPGEVFVMAVGRHPEIVPWGELLTTACVMRGARGLVADGLVRDSRKIKAMKVPVFCSGRRPLDSAGRGKVAAYDVPIVIDGVRIQPGDFILADADGVVVIPKAVERQVFESSWAKVAGENRTRDALLAGRLLREVYEEFGIL